jgi:hypothetical protein
MDTVIRAPSIPANLQRLIVTDSPRQAVARVTDAATRRFGLTYRPPIRRRWILGE